MSIKYLWIDSEVNLYTPARDEFFIELSKQSTFHNLKINDSINNSNIDLIYFINSFIKKNNIDFLLLDPWELLFEFYFQNNNRFQFYNITTSKTPIISKFISKFFNKLECKKIFLGGWFDFHRLDTETVDIISNFLNDKNNFFFGLTNKYYKKNSQIKNIPSFTTNINKIDLEIKFKKNFIPFQHFFSFEYNFKKDFLLNVPGARGSYPLREKIYNDLMLYNYENSNEFKFLNNMRKINYNNYLNSKNKFTLKLFNDFYYYMISKSKYNYTDGGLMGYPIKKYIEIPAMNSILISEEIEAIEDLGYEKNINFIEYKKGENLIEKIITLDDEKCSNILINSRKLIKNFHTVEIRINNFITICNKILKEQYNSSFYYNGKMIIN